jgi:predicted dehydrogenase
VGSRRICARRRGKPPHPRQAREGYESFDAVLKKVHPDLAIVLATDAAHVEVARQAVDHNVPALVERPLSPDYFEARSGARRSDPQGSACSRGDDQFETTLFDEETGPAKPWLPSIPNTLMFDEEFRGYVGQLENVFDAVRGLAPLASSGLDGAAAVGLIEATRRSIETAAETD